MTSLGIWACRWRELKPIVFGGASAPGSAPERYPSRLAATDADEEEGGWISKGNVRGKGRDGRGEFEMVSMASDKR